jgi:HSP20 family protein
MKAMAAESRENLDHLQRARKNPQQSQHKKRVAPAAPIGNQEQKLHQLYMKKKIWSVIKSFEKSMDDIERF